MSLQEVTMGSTGVDFGQEPTVFSISSNCDILWVTVKNIRVGE